MVNSVKLNDRGQRFVDAEFVLGVEPRQGGVATPWFELDASGKDKGHPDAAGATGRVAMWGARGTRSAVIFDLDGDGDLDIVTNEFNAAPMVLVSNLTEKTPRALPRGEAHRDDVEPQRRSARCQGHRRRDRRTRRSWTATRAICRTASTRCTSGWAPPRRSTASKSCGRPARTDRAGADQDQFTASTCASRSQAQPARVDACRRLRRPVADAARTAARCGTNCASKRGSGGSNVFASRSIVPRRSLTSPWMKDPCTPPPSTMSIS